MKNSHETPSQPSMEYVLDCIDNSGPVEKQAINKELPLKDFELELAYHEASHFVFSCLILKNLVGFTPLNFVIICPQKYFEGGFNKINGVMPAGVPERLTYVGSNMEEAVGFKEFYNSNRNRLIAKLLSTVAGHASYQVFIKNEKFYIHCPIQIEKNQPIGDSINVDGYQEQFALNSDRSDFIYLKRKLLNYFSFKGDQLAQATSVIISSAQELMKMQSVKVTIGFIKNQLLQSPCKRIEGEQVRDLVREVKRMTNKVPFIKILEELKMELNEVQNSIKNEA